MWVVAACFAYMTLAVLAQVLGRYVFNYSISWTEETAKFAQIRVVPIGAGITMRRGLHVAVDVLDAMLPLSLARALMVLAAIGCLWFLGVVVYGSLPLGAIYFGITLFVASSVAERNIIQVSRRIFWPWLMMTVILILVTFVPEIGLFLPRLAGLL